MAIYESKGKAAEYCRYALNLYRGCDHCCSYCYAPAVLRMGHEEFGADPQPRPGVIESLRKTAHKFAGKWVLLSFTSDPYQAANEKHGLTRQALEIMRQAEVRPVILTKGGTRSTVDFDILQMMGKNAAYGTTLTLDDETRDSEWEPGAGKTWERLGALRRAYELGIRTWVSFEPVLNPQQTLDFMYHVAPFCDEMKIGRWNHDARANLIDWAAFGVRAVDLAERLGVRYYVKDDLRKHLPAAYQDKGRSSMFNEEEK
ncbi:MAG: radical SAM protein [Patescibacteria group bacterium]